MIDTDEYIEMWNDHLLGSEGVQDLMNALIAKVERLREELALYEKYAICHPDGTHCCDECLERNGFEVIE
jgi:hypothetical protein